MVHQFYQTVGQAPGQLLHRDVAHLSSAGIEQTVRIRENVAVLEANSHVVDTGKQPADVPGSRMMESDPVPACVDPLTGIRHRRSDHVTQLSHEPANVW